jgi:hypothetical protein
MEKAMVLGQRCYHKNKKSTTPMQAQYFPTKPAKAEKDHVPVAKDYDWIRAMVGKEVMGNDVLRVLQHPFHDCAKYVLNSCDSECAIQKCCSCKLATHEVEDDSPPIQEREPP